METKEPVIFENLGRKFKYDFNALNVEQAELAKEVIEFKYNTFKNPPQDFNQVLKSKATDWLPMAMSYLLLEMGKDDITLSFRRDKAQSDVEVWIKNLPISNQDKLKECALDFFTNIGLSSMILELSSSERRKNASETLMPFILQTMMKGSLPDLTTLSQ